MPDFADKRPERELHKPTAPKQGAVKEEKPLQQFKRLLKNLDDTVRTLRTVKETAPTQPAAYQAKVAPQVAALKAAAQPAAPIAAAKPIIPNTAPVRRSEPVLPAHTATKSSSPVSVVREMGQIARTAAVSTPAPKVEHAPIRSPVVRRSASASASVDRRMPTPVTGADKEARRQFTQNDPKAAENEPSAARLAQIMRANELMAEGTIKPHSSIQGWAKSISAGDRRQVADIDAEHVQKVLHEAVGGAAAAERLLRTSEVNKLIERHDTRLETMRSSVKETEKQIERRSGSAPAARSTTVSRLPVDSKHATVPALPKTEQTSVKELEHMLASNEEPHLQMEQINRQQAMQMEDRANGSASFPGQSPMATGQNAVNSTGPTIAAHGSRGQSGEPGTPTGQQQRPEAIEGPRGAPRSVVSTISAPPNKPLTLEQKRETESTGKKSQKMELTGRMTLVTKTGQMIGTGDIELRN